MLQFPEKPQSHSLSLLFCTLVYNTDASLINYGLHRLFSFHLQEKKQCRNKRDTCCKTEITFSSCFEAGEPAAGVGYRRSISQAVVGARPCQGHDKHFSNAYH